MLSFNQELDNLYVAIPNEELRTIMTSIWLTKSNLHHNLESYNYRRFQDISLSTTHNHLSQYSMLELKHPLLYSRVQVTRITIRVICTHKEMTIVATKQFITLLECARQNIFRCGPVLEIAEL